MEDDTARDPNSMPIEPRDPIVRVRRKKIKQKGKKKKKEPVQLPVRTSRSTRYSSLASEQMSQNPCREGCRRLLRGCFRIPGCKIMCLKCILPPCYSCVDSDEETDGNYELGHNKEEVKHVVPQPPVEHVERVQHVDIEMAEMRPETVALIPPKRPNGNDYRKDPCEKELGACATEALPTNSKSSENTYVTVGNHEESKEVTVEDTKLTKEVETREKDTKEGKIDKPLVEIYENSVTTEAVVNSDSNAQFTEHLVVISNKVTDATNQEHEYVNDKIPGHDYVNDNILVKPEGAKGLESVDTSVHINTGGVGTDKVVDICEKSDSRDMVTTESSHIPSHDSKGSSEAYPEPVSTAEAKDNPEKKKDDLSRVDSMPNYIAPPPPVQQKRLLSAVKDEEPDSKTVPTSSEDTSMKETKVETVTKDEVVTSSSKSPDYARLEVLTSVSSPSESSKVSKVVQETTVSGIEYSLDTAGSAVGSSQDSPQLDDGQERVKDKEKLIKRQSRSSSSSGSGAEDEGDGKDTGTDKDKLI